MLDAPDAATVGELVKLDASQSVADSYKWIILPESDDFLVYDGGARAVFSAREPGEYRFVLAVAKNGTVDVITHVVTVRGPPKPPTTNDLAAWVAFWTRTSRLPREEALALASSFESVASRVDTLKTPKEWIKATAEANREALGKNITRWVPLLDKIGAALKKMAETGLLETPEQHAKVWLKIAEGLRKG